MFMFMIILILCLYIIFFN